MAGAKFNSQNGLSYSSLKYFLILIFEREMKKYNCSYKMKSIIHINNIFIQIFRNDHQSITNSQKRHQK